MENNEKIEQELQKPLGWLEKIKARRFLKQQKRKITTAKKSKDKKKIEKTRKQIIQAITQMQPEIEIFEDDEMTIPTTKEHLEKKTIEELEKMFEEMLDLALDNKW